MSSTNLQGLTAALPDKTGAARSSTWRIFDPEFLNYVIREKKNRRYLRIASISTVLQFIFLKLLYPFPDFISDSYAYIFAAKMNYNAHLWPIGYSKILRFFHQITPSDVFLLATQYVAVQLSILVFFFTFTYFYRPTKITERIIFVCLLFNPLILFLSNFVLSDAFFTAFSLLWFTDLIWLIHSPQKRHLIIQPLLIGICFTLRYAAIIYPLISIQAYWLSKYTIREKVIGALTPLLVIGAFIVFTTQETYKATGTRQFSVFGGWQIANNAMYMFQHIEINPAQLPPATRELNKLTAEFHRDAPEGYINLDNFPGTYFIKHADAPLKQYLYRHYAQVVNSDSTLGFKSWAAVSPMYQQYGTYLIGHHPFAFARYYLFLNLKNYAYPYLEKYSNYNLGMDSVGSIISDWFQYKSRRVYTNGMQIQEALFFAAPVIWLLLNIWATYFGLKLLLKRKTIRRQTTPLILFLIVNLLFSVFATPIVLRYQLLPMLLLIPYLLKTFEYENL